MADETKQEAQEQQQPENTPTPDEEAEFDAGWNDDPESVDEEPSADDDAKSEEARDDEKQDAAPSDDKSDAAGDNAKADEKAGEDGEGADKEEKSSAAEQVDPEELRRLRANEQSMMGRLEKERQRNAELQIKLQQYEKSKRENKGKVKIDEDMEALADDFGRKFPALVDLLMEDSDEGARVREALEEGGTITAGMMAENIHRQRETETRQYADIEAARNQHNDELARRHPEFAEYILDPEKRQIMVNAMMRWVNKTMMYAEGSEIVRILQEGSTDEVSGLLGRFSTAVNELSAQDQKEEAKKKQEEADRKEKEKRAADGAAVPTRRQPSKTPPAPPDDFDAAWDEAMRTP
ncbi:hypothetical protein [Oceanidesulfovibrio marinus]|uniref:Uncharacterized protein n=1 Tax=Oceanidesulfovibrio marinus TaxID=370038 RepID=A0A6P1ZJW9_9BACT|nr:hypothetical protein [Oceanidesulfovibrio marinus]TVM35610.1 hypothetical protein DQK91_02800 [Oceanidesulfovibrio marinus]